MPDAASVGFHDVVLMDVAEGAASEGSIVVDVSGGEGAKVEVGGEADGSSGGSTYHGRQEIVVSCCEVATSTGEALA